jgi:pyrroloquinoline quinone biosynthesis protein D
MIPSDPRSRPRLARKARLKYDEVDKQYLLLSPERGMKLSETAAEILKRCDGARTVEAIAEELAQASSAPRAQVEKDTLAFVDELLRRGLVEVT